MRRSLVLTDESARHPFLASLPPHVRRVCAPSVRQPRRWALSFGDLRHFMMAYCASFLAVSVFIY
ncbi:MAG: hypothetical protein PHE36_04325 [Novosphingobium sp.]|nr:hypothetical protein [Novosphingobium sp.]